MPHPEGIRAGCRPRQLLEEIDGLEIEFRLVVGIAVGVGDAKREAMRAEGGARRLDPAAEIAEALDEVEAVDVEADLVAHIANARQAFPGVAPGEIFPVELALMHHEECR